MYIRAAGVTDPVTLGLGVIAVALFFGEFAFFKWIYGPALDRADKQLIALENRYKEELANCRETIRRLEDKLDRQSLVLEDRALPALIAATTTVSEFQQLMTTIKSDQDRINRERELEEATKLALKERVGGI